MILVYEEAELELKYKPNLLSFTATRVIQSYIKWLFQALKSNLYLFIHNFEGKLMAKSESKIIDW